MSREPDEEIGGILVMVRMCQNYNTLPGAGGLLDQDSYFVFLMQHILLFDQERAEIEEARAKAR